VNKEFHFNTVYILAREAGFTEADSFTLAGSSQFVDEAVFNLQFSLPDEEMQCIITQSYQFWDDSTQKNIYLPFHFIPGNINEPLTQLKNNSINPYCVIANGALAKEALITSLEQRDIFLIGIALHGFADTWAHQYFSGKNEQWNANSESNVFNAAKQAIGHMQFGTQPDTCGAIWQDNRLYEPACNNIERFREAAKKIYRYLSIYNNKSFDDEDFILDKLCSIWKRPDSNERYADYILEWGVPEWSYKLWFEQAGLEYISQNTDNGILDSMLNSKIKQKIELFINHINTKTVICPSSFKQSNLYRWTQSAHYYKNIMSKILEREHLL